MPVLFQCVPNFSEGRRPEVVEEIADAIRGSAGVDLIDYSSDRDHNRCVMTYLGDGAGVRAAALAAARVAVARIDLRTHTGIHPRTGALDVLPVVPLAGAGRSEAVEIARNVGGDLAEYLELPVFFYEWCASVEHRSSLPNLRRGGFEAIAGTRLTGDYTPDLGPHLTHTTAGIAIVGARGPLVAYNINLKTSDVTIAHAIARRIRNERGTRPELTGVRALGLYLESRGCAQVSMNLTQPDLTPLPAVFGFVKEATSKLGVEILESEVIGAIPEASLGGGSPNDILWRDFRPKQVLAALA